MHRRALTIAASGLARAIRIGDAPGVSYWQDRLVALHHRPGGAA